MILSKLLKYWKSILVSAEIALLIYFSYHIIGPKGISGTNFILTLTFISAILNTLFFIIFIVYSGKTYTLLNKIGKILSVINFIYTSLVFSDTLSVYDHWIPAFVLSLFVAGLALQFYIGLGNLPRINRTWLFRINSFLIIIVTFYGIFLLLLRTEKGQYYETFYYGIVLVFLISLISNLINYKPHEKEIATD